MKTWMEDTEESEGRREERGQKGMESEFFSCVFFLLIPATALSVYYCHFSVVHPSYANVECSESHVPVPRSAADG